MQKVKELTPNEAVEELYKIIKSEEIEFEYKDKVISHCLRIGLWHGMLALDRQLNAVEAHLQIEKFDEDNKSNPSPKEGIKTGKD